ncbi:unnamed protein product, partial [Gongylonema pulchrum]|uniref:Rad60-SLD_2 domain-containing protein n=1 Tax=Gongylonema pulchrum TaxID=637853 RepID=A0A183E9K3_9BILA
MAEVRVPLTITSAELMERCRKRIDNPAEFVEIFDEKVKPPSLPESPKGDKLPPEKLQNFCYNSTIALIRGLTQTLKMDLSLFSTKSLLEIAPEHEVEIRSQYLMPSDQNVDHLGQPTWECHSTRGGVNSTDIANGSSKRRRASGFEESQMPMKLIKFGTNVDLSDDIKFKRKLNFLKGSWWPDIDELLEANIPVHRFTQKAGDVVW